MAVAVATAAAAEAAVAAAQAAAEVFRIAGTPSYHWSREIAAIKIQTAFRGYLVSPVLLLICEANFVSVHRITDVLWSATIIYHNDSDVTYGAIWSMHADTCYNEKFHKLAGFVMVFLD